MTSRSFMFSATDSFNNAESSIVSEYLDKIDTEVAKDPEILTSYASYVIPDHPLQRHAEISAKSWLRQRRASLFKQSQTVRDLVEALFHTLDEDNSGYIRAVDLVEQIIGLGLANDPAIIINVRSIKIICTTFKQKDFLKLNLTLDQLTAFFLGDRRSDHILKRLDKLAEEEISRKNLSEKSSIIFKPGSSVLVESAKRSMSMSPKLYLDFNRHTLNLTNKPKSNSSTDHAELLKKWWKELDPLGRGFADVSEVANKLVEKQLVGNSFEGRKILGIVDNKGAIVTTLQFNQVFARSMIKGALINLSKRLSTGSFSNPYFTPLMKMSLYKRKLIISKYKLGSEDISRSEGESATRAIESFQNYIKSMQT